MLTRAISLLVLICDHETLASDTNWNKLISLAFEKKAVNLNGKKIHPRITMSQ